VTASSRNAKKARESIYGVVTVCWRVSRRNTRRQWGTGTAAGGYLTGPCKQRRAKVKGKRQRCRAEAAVVEGGREAGKLNALTWTNTFKNAATKKNKNAAPRKNATWSAGARGGLKPGKANPENLSSMARQSSTCSDLAESTATVIRCTRRRGRKGMGKNSSGGWRREEELDSRVNWPWAAVVWTNERANGSAWNKTKKSK
jgi:hypothetical protein